MKLSEVFLPEYDQEMKTTRATLERIPEDKLTWRPHEKSMPLGRLAGHIAEMAGWPTVTIKQDSIHFTAAGGQQPMQPLVATSRKELLETFDGLVTQAHQAIAGVSDEELMKPWSLLKSGQVLMTMPKLNVLRTFCINHIIHHRAQLGVYLRLNNIPVPSVYGPSADEGAV